MSSNQSYSDLLSMDTKVLGNKALTNALIWYGLEYTNLSSFVINPYDNSLISALKVGAYGAVSDIVGSSLRKIVPQLKVF